MKDKERHASLEMHMLMPQTPSPADELCRLLRVDTEQACKELATLLPQINWDKENPWYAARLYDLLILASKFDEPTLARATCRVCKTHPEIKSPSSEKSLIHELLDRTIKDQSSKALEVALTFAPGHLPKPEYMDMGLFGRASSKGVEDTLRVLLASWQSVHGADAMLPPETAMRLLSGTLSHGNLKMLKFVLPLVASTRQEMSVALAPAINYENDKASKFLVKKASVCEALLNKHDLLTDKQVELAYDRFAEEMDEGDLLSTDYLWGDKFHLPKIKSRAQSMRLRASVPCAPPRRPSRRL